MNISEKEEVRQFLKTLALTEYPRYAKEQDLPRIIETLIIGSYAPESQPLKSTTKIACIGSCFAEEIAKTLTAQGRNPIHVSLAEKWSSLFAVRHCIESALENKPFPEGFIPDQVDISNLSFSSLGEADAFIITAGMSICWFDLRTNKMTLDARFPGQTGKALVQKMLNYTMRQTSLADNVAQLDAIVSCIRRTRGAVPIIFTLSPIPIIRAVTDTPPIPSNTVSKAIVRAALHELMERGLEGVFYWPSYEIIEYIGRHIRTIYGKSQDSRHPEASVIHDVMLAFDRLYFAQS